MSFPMPSSVHDFRAPAGASGEALVEISLEDVAALLHPSRTAFFFDVDGTLIDIAPHPDAVYVSKMLVDDLDRLSAASDGAVALVSGREVAVLDRLFQPLEMSVSGVHGAQFRRRPGGEMSLVEDLPQGIRSALKALAATFSGVLVEDKGASVALHYRNDPGIASVLEDRIAKVVSADARTLTVLPGRMVFEVKRRGHDKGAAVRAFMSEPPFAGRTPVFIGDDVTDEAGFAAVRELDGIAISIGRRLPGADFTLPQAEDVRALVKHLAHFFERRD